MALAGSKAAGGQPRRLFIFNAGFLRQPRLRRILSLAGWQVSLGLPRAGQHVGVWGASPYAHRGEAMAARSGATLVRVEDAFLRSVLPGRAGGVVGRRGPVGLMIDPVGLHFDADQPSRIEELVTSAQALALEAQAQQAIRRLIDADLSIDFAQVTTPDDRVAVIATAPLTDNETWTQFAPGELIMFEHGRPTMTWTVPIPPEVQAKNAANTACT